MASPHVAGTVALMISYARSQGVSLSVDTIKQLLKTTAVDLGQSGPDNDYGWGRIDAFAALVLLASDANEPNDNPSQATFIAFGETKFGKIEPDDEDFFKFTGTQNTVITVKIDAQSLGSGIDAVLQILDSDGTTVLAESDDSNGSKYPYIAKFVLPHAGDFYIRITSKDFANELRHYALTLKLRSVPNLIATYNPQDNSVTLQWGSVFNSHRLASKRPMIRPLDLQGYRVYRATQAQGPYDLIASLPPDQTTYTDTNLPGQLVLYYRVTALYDEGESDPATARILADPTEPNDDPTTATQIAYGQSLQGTIAVSGDVDFYKFDGQAGALVTVEVRAEVDGSSLDSVLTLYDSDGQTVLAFNDDFADWWPVTLDSKLVRFPLPHDGTFYLKVADYWGSGSENHFYTLTLVKDTPDDHGDWPQNATPINAGENLPGVINPPPDTDYFVFNANAGDLIIAEIFARRQDPPSSLDSMLALYDEQGKLLAFNDDYYGLDSAIFYQIPQTGRYFLQVMPYGGPYRGGPDYTYTLSMTLLLPPRISVTPISIEETLLQGSRSVVSVNVANVGGESLTFFTRSATSAISTLSVQQPARRRIMFVPETSKLYQDYLRLRQQKQRELQQVIPKLLAKRDPNSQRLTQALQDSVVSPELIPLKGGKPISTLQNEQSPSGTWRWIIVDPDEYGEQQGNAINVTKVFYQSNGTYLYFRAELDGGNFDPQNAYFDIFLDTDRNAGTGDRQIVDGMGIDYILYGGLEQVGVFKFNPATGNFEQVADFIWFERVNGAVEVGVKLSDIGNPIDLHVACEFYDRNTGRRDRIPDIWYAPITREVPWLDRSPVAGSLLANESVNVELTLDSTSLGLGIHRTNLVFNSNDLEKQQLTVPITLTIMQIPNVPDLISPADGAIVRPQVTFVLKSTDPDGDRVKFVIEARKGNEVKTYETEYVSSGQEASLTVPEGLSSGEWTWRAKAIDERGQESSFSSEQTFIVNQLPTKPELIAPNNNAIVSTTPTFKLKSSDADGDQVKFEIEVAKGSRVEVLVTNFVNSGTEVSLIVPEDQSLSPGQWTWRARAIDARGEAGEWSDSRTIQVISVPLIRSGLRLVACPVIGPADPKPVFAFDENKWAWFDPTSGYLLYPNSQTNLQVGKGYWAKFVQDTKPNVEGTLPDTNQPFSVALKKGWNLIGNPWLVDLVWDLSSIKVKVGGQEKALKDLGESEGVEPYAWRWDGSNYRLVYDTNVGIIGIDSALPSWEGAWVYAHTDCELILPPPSQGKGRGTRGEGRVAKGNGWSMRLQASVDGSVGEAVLGIANGTRGLAVGLPPEPPTGNNGVQVILLKNNTPLAVDVRNDGSRRQEWEVLVRFGTRDGGRGTSERKEVVLTFDGIGYAPKDVSAWLVDTVTGKRLYLRTQPSYRFVAQEGEVERKFKVVVERGNDRPLRVVGLKATPMRGQGVVIEFSLTKPAKVEAEVLTLTGRRVAVLDAGSSEGLTRRVVWRGVGIEGQKVGGGVYLIRVRAIDDEGRSTQGMTIVRTR